MFTIVIPLFNEQRNIITLLDEINLSLKNFYNYEIIIIDDLKLSSHKTKELALILKNFNFNSALFVYDPYKLDQNFKRASHNIPKISMLSHSGINVRDLIHHEKIFIVKDSIDAISKRLS